jgi:serine/threonine protein kinase
LSDHQFKNYTIERELGKGGMAAVYLARDQSGRPVALKFLLPHIATNDVFIRQFMEEFRANQFLRHANIVETIDGGEHEGKWFIAMEYLDGGSLKELLRDRPRPPLDLAVHVAINVLKGLQHSHHCGIVHQDMKPANLMVQQDGSIKIADFGISRIASPALWTPTGKIKGTPSYMAPEQAAGREPNYKWDIFSTGVIVYELVAGFNPFGAKDPQDALRKIAGENAPPLMRAVPTVPYDIEVVIAKMLEKDPDRRYQNVDAILGDLQRITAKLQLVYSQEVLRDWMTDPGRVGAALTSNRSRFHLEQGRKLVATGKATADVGLWEIYRAALLDPDAEEPRLLLHETARTQGYSLQTSNAMAIKSLEARLADHPDDIKSLLQVARLYRADGNVLQTFYFARSALSLAPLDPGVISSVDKALGAGKVQYL